MKIIKVFPTLLKNRWTFVKFSRNTYSDQPSTSQKSYDSTPSNPVPDVPGLSEKVLMKPSGKVGPGASKSSEYKNPEYFSYNTMSYYEAEIEMAKYRLPQPSSLSNQ